MSRSGKIRVKILAKSIRSILIEGGTIPGNILSRSGKIRVQILAKSIRSILLGKVRKRHARPLQVLTRTLPRLSQERILPRNLVTSCKILVQGCSTSTFEDMPLFSCSELFSASMSVWHGRPRFLTSVLRPVSQRNRSWREMSGRQFALASTVRRTKSADFLGRVICPVLRG